MATKTKTTRTNRGQKAENATSPRQNSSLVFISHDTRDAELAEEFSNLLKIASAGGLKSFRSSDRKGTQGIEYGLDWYPAIMDKIDEASDVVCLLTQRSVDRPWILYEAGVAKGKLGKKVIGVAMGVQNSVAFTGPFAQFQNNDGSAESIAKLVFDLISNVPGLEPDKGHISQLVEAFHKKMLEIVSRDQKSTRPVREQPAEDLVPKLFEEIKIMFEKLPSKIESRVNPELRQEIDLYQTIQLVDEMMRYGKQESNRHLAFLVIISSLKEEFPWIFEIGMETYKGLRSFKTTEQKQKLIESFEKAVDLLEVPVVWQRIKQVKDPYMLVKELKHFTRRYFEKYQSSALPRKRNA